MATRKKGEAIGKLSDDTSMSCSRLAALLGYSPHNSFGSTPNDELQKSIDALERKSNREDPQSDSPAYWGNKLEGEILLSTADRIGVDADIEILERVTHKEIPLQGSLDGIGKGTGQVIRTDSSKNIFVIGADSITLDGPGVLEAKLTGSPAKADPEPFRGPVQVQGLMMCTGYKWAAIGTLYRGTDLKVYLCPQDKSLQEKIRFEVKDFQSRIDLYRNDGVTDWYNALTPNDAANTYHFLDDDQKPITLPEKLSELAMEYLDNEAAAKALASHKREIMTVLMDYMGAKEKAMVIENGKTVAEVIWGMTPPRTEYVVKARPAQRSKSIKIKGYH